MKNLTLSLAGLVIVLGLVSFVPDIASAHRGDPSVKGPNYSAECHEAMESAFENNDYQAWKSLMGDRGRVTQVINESNFAKFAEAHRLAEQGKISEAKQIREELGLGLHNGSGRGQGQGMRGMNR